MDFLDLATELRQEDSFIQIVMKKIDLVKPDLISFFNPIENCKVYSTYWVKNRHTERVNHANVDESIHERKFEANFHLKSCVQILELLLPE